MTVYDAILQAADHIERHPDQFDFYRTAVPTIRDYPSDGKFRCNSIGCALGWISYFLGYGAGCGYRACMKDLGLAGDHWFYARLDELTRMTPGWRYSANLCAQALRLYAEKYHGDEKLDPAYVKLRGDLNEAAAIKALQEA